MLRIDHLTCGYGAGFMLEDVSLDVKDGEMMGVIGPNGSGKTTLLRAITGILKARQGGIRLAGRDIRSMGVNEIARAVAVVSQSAEAPAMTVQEFVLLGRMPHFGRFQFLERKEDVETAREAMRLTDCYRIRDHLMGNISGGEKQLVCIARAIAQQTRLLLLDEPTAHLDITHQVGILDLIRRLNGEFGLTVVMVLHDLNLAAEYCHTLTLLSKGKLHIKDVPDKVIDYRIIEDVYKTVVVVRKNPISSKPYVVIVSGDDARKPCHRNGA